MNQNNISESSNVTYFSADSTLTSVALDAEVARKNSNRFYANVIINMALIVFIFFIEVLSVILDDAGNMWDEFSALYVFSGFYLFVAFIFTMITDAKIQRFATYMLIAPIVFGPVVIILFSMM